MAETIETEASVAPNRAGDPGDVILGPVTFSMFMYWPNADVDIMLSEVGSPFQPTRTVEDSDTPTSTSVEMFYQALCRDQKLTEAGIKVAATYGFCQGTARIDFEVELSYENLNKLRTYVRTAQQRMRMLSRKWVSFYAKGTSVRPGSVMMTGR